MNGGKGRARNEPVESGINQISSSVGLLGECKLVRARKNLKARGGLRRKAGVRFDEAKDWWGGSGYQVCWRDRESERKRGRGRERERERERRMEME